MTEPGPEDAEAGAVAPPLASPLVPPLVPLAVAARRLGAWCWAERRCFEVLGGWVADTEDPRLAALFAAHSRHHAWRAAVWEDVLPRAYVPPIEELTAPTADAHLFDALAALQPAGKRLEGHYHVLYRALVSAYEVSPVLMNPVTDGPALRAIRIIVGDASCDLAEASSAPLHPDGGISGPDRLTHLRDAVAKVQVSMAEGGRGTLAIGRWGS